MDNTNKKQKAAFRRGKSTRAKQLAKARLRQRKLAEEASERNDSDCDTIIYDHNDNHNDDDVNSNNSTISDHDSTASSSRTEIKLGHMNSKTFQTSGNNTGM